MKPTHSLGFFLRLSSQHKDIMSRDWTSQGQVKVLTKALGVSGVSGSRTYTMSIIASMSAAMLRTVIFPTIFPVLSLH